MDINEHTSPTASSGMPQFTSFTTASSNDVAKLIRSSPSKHCKLDALPTWLIKEHTQEFAPLIASIINTSLTTGEVPAMFKEAVVTPSLKKSSCSIEELSNYRPVSNIHFCGKLLERVVATQLHQYLNDNGLMEPMQSAYRQYHSTETALVRVYNVLTLGLDNKKVALLVLLDLSAAFDTIDHDLLINRCEKLFGISGIPLAWLRSYMNGRSQKVIIGQSSSSARALMCGVPQGSVLGPLLFIMYTTPLGQLLRNENMDYHMYADDTQLFAISTVDEIANTKAHMEQTIDKVKNWMSSNLLKLNAGKTELITISHRNQIKDLHDTVLNVSGERIQPSQHARNIGVTMDSTLSMIPHISNTTRNLNFHLRNIGRIRPYLTQATTEMFIHSLVSSRLDFCNALLASQPSCRLRGLQLAQNTAARIVCQTPRRQHITPVLYSLHWLPVEARIKYKLCLLTFKCLTQQAPQYLMSLVEPYSSGRDLRSDNARLLTVRRTNYAIGSRCFSVAGPQAWNSLPVDLRMCNSLLEFKRKLKTHLFQCTYSHLL